MQFIRKRKIINFEPFMMSQHPIGGCTKNILNRDGRLALLIVLVTHELCQIFGQISDQNALFLMERGGLG